MPAAKPNINFDFKLKPVKAQEYLNNKGFNLTFDYDEMQHGAHHKSFTVAKVTRVDLLNDIFTSLKEAQASGETFSDWQKKLKPTLQKKGWWGKKDIVNPKTGEVKEVYIGARRLRTIFNVNMRVAYGVQRHHTMSQLTLEVYWRYSSMFLPNSRDAHKKADGILLHRDDPYWLTNYPPNDYLCVCKVRAYSEKQAKKKGLSLAKKAPDSVASKDWAYDVGAGSKVAKLSKLNLADNLPAIKPNPALDKLTDEQLKDQFYQTLGTAKGELFIDKVGDPMFIGDELFSALGQGASKIKKRSRHLYIDELAKTINDPDEIFIEAETLKTGETRLVKKMFRYFEDGKGNSRGFMALFKYDKDKTIGVSIYDVASQSGTEARRIEKLIYRKKDKSE